MNKQLPWKVNLLSSRNIYGCRGSTSAWRNLSFFSMDVGGHGDIDNSCCCCCCCSTSGGINSFFFLRLRIKIFDSIQNMRNIDRIKSDFHKTDFCFPTRSAVEFIQKIGKLFGSRTNSSREPHTAHW